MICHHCLRLRAAARRNGLLNTTLRQFSKSSPRRAQPVTAQTTTSTNPRPHDSVPAATSTSATQPFSAPLSSPSLSSGQTVQHPAQPTMRVRSSVPAGTVLKGLTFMKNKPEVVALEDAEYPDWLWGVLEEREGDGESREEGEGDLFSKSKKERRRAAKALRRQQLLDPESMAPKVPLYEQSVDLPTGNTREAGEKRAELTKVMRVQRRAKIKEGNFLKAM